MNQTEATHRLITSSGEEVIAIVENALVSTAFKGPTLNPVTGELDFEEVETIRGYEGIEPATKYGEMLFETASGKEVLGGDVLLETTTPAGETTTKPYAAGVSQPQPAPTTEMASIKRALELATWMDGVRHDGSITPEQYERINARALQYAQEERITLFLKRIVTAISPRSFDGL